MKKLIVIAAVVALLIPAFAFAAPPEVPKPNISQICQENEDFGAATHGACVSVFQACTDKEGLDFNELCVCKFLRAAYPVWYNDFYGSNGLGECVQLLKVF
jgi:hypothetical protein